MHFLENDHCIQVHFDIILSTAVEAGEKLKSNSEDCHNFSMSISIRKPTTFEKFWVFFEKTARKVGYLRKNEIKPEFGVKGKISPTA